ncbi:hypothetical protein HHL16_08250 [Pseudoflavitalea sp. G-6-1-2]|uniref:hypothetical protein n=1 Tax=Pseudoflavitalea sp. G-6-1-2 TaxID=2728841 RepID=UPI00146C4BEA|nr:hypothetical protein [Pseudoflavitalea sp. G-6-1-2]NML20862.1 hypothetical protein [Pseudoflavitalea sp. G-6-1-2]
MHNTVSLRKLLWADFILGGSTAVTGLAFSQSLTGILGFSLNFILIVSGITLLYALVALILANQKKISAGLLSILMRANWIWALISVGLVIAYFEEATILGRVFLILQVLVVGGLAYLEGKNKHTINEKYTNPV